ncbi:hypothetical protein [Streptomyces sp. NPDC060035]|uniref:hypothetical protein n=1 Tax=Streptomyces sp. NPDC060035 TaxID=3347044 RepID=UPI0036BF81B8
MKNIARRAAKARMVSAARRPSILASAWTFELRRDERDELELYFFLGDPDSRSTYVLTREQS